MGTAADVQVMTRGGWVVTCKSDLREFGNKCTDVLLFVGNRANENFKQPTTQTTIQVHGITIVRIFLVSTASVIFEATRNCSMRCAASSALVSCANAYAWIASYNCFLRLKKRDSVASRRHELCMLASSDLTGGPPFIPLSYSRHTSQTVCKLRHRRYD